MSDGWVRRYQIDRKNCMTSMITVGDWLVDSLIDVEYHEEEKEIN